MNNMMNKQVKVQRVNGAGELAHSGTTQQRCDMASRQRLSARGLMLLTAAGLLLSGTLLSGTAAARSLTAIDTSARALDLVALQQQASSTQDDYQFAYAQYRLAVTASVTSKDEALVNDALAVAAERLDTLSRSGDPQLQTEALALLASVRGMQAGLSPLKGAYYGKLSDDAVQAAAALDANNPRLLLVQAILAYQTPALFGGSSKRAQQFAEAAVAAFAKPCSGICWGGEEAYVWRGLAKQANGDAKGAQADWQAALQQAPDYGWAQQLLATRADTTAHK